MSMENNIILYTTSDGCVNVQVQFEDGTFWLAQKRIAELFGVDVRTVNEHLQNIFKSGELEKEATIRKIRIVQQECTCNKRFFRVGTKQAALGHNREDCC
jgi:Virulence protein